MKRIWADWNRIYDVEVEGEEEYRRVDLGTMGSKQSIEEIGGIYEGMRLLADDGDVETEIIIERDGNHWYGRLATDFRTLDGNYDYWKN